MSISERSVWHFVRRAGPSVWLVSVSGEVSLEVSWADVGGGGSLCILGSWRGGRWDAAGRMGGDTTNGFSLVCTECTPY